MRRAIAVASFLAFAAGLALAQDLAISTTSLPAGKVGQAYSQTVAATGGTAPYTFSASGLPAGFSIDPASGLISGTPVEAGTYSVVLGVTDSLSATASSGTLSLTIALAVSGLTPDGIVGVPYTATISASGGRNPFHWSATGLPAGLALGDGNSSSVPITGTPTAAGHVSAIISVTDGNGAAGSLAVSFDVIGIAVNLSISPGTIPNGAVGVAYPSTTFTASGGIPPYTWSATGLPPGLSLDTQSGTLS
ncbi:MAG TPA: Ig domain-containing protein, partial [Bryobacteraceae bacterium]|nr:Ig domain-containing protein [Bryobacteraceae bacterium]